MCVCVCVCMCACVCVWVCVGVYVCVCVLSVCVSVLSVCVFLGLDLGLTLGHCVCCVVSYHKKKEVRRKVYFKKKG